MIYYKLQDGVVETNAEVGEVVPSPYPPDRVVKYRDVEVTSLSCVAKCRILFLGSNSTLDCGNGIFFRGKGAVAVFWVEDAAGMKLAIKGNVEIWCWEV